MTLYVVLKFIHILSAIVAVGANITYGVWNARASRQPNHAAFTLNGIRFIDNRIANPAYGVLLITGLVMVFMGWKITDLWVIVSLVAFIAIAVVGFAVFTPLLRDQIKLAEAGDTSSSGYVRLANRSRTIGPALGILVVVILVMMVFKPTL
jgi:uncharacterized membrane protein